jgi:hypothetical protein
MTFMLLETGQISSTTSKRWLAKDPLTQKFPSVTPYSAFANNPILNIDKDGKEPSKNQAINLTDYIPKLKKLNITSLEEFRKAQSAERYRGYYEKAGPLGYDRYLYSDKWGWIDMLHFSDAALNSSKKGINSTLEWGETLEALQTITAPASSHSYEDITSNLLGAVFGAYQNKYSDKSLINNLETYLIEIGFNTCKEDAPNWQIMPKKQIGSEPLGLKEYKYDPLFAPDHDKLNTDIDKFIIQSLNDFNSEQEEKSKQSEERLLNSPLQNK